MKLILLTPVALLTVQFVARVALLIVVVLLLARLKVTPAKIVDAVAVVLIDCAPAPSNIKVFVPMPSTIGKVAAVLVVVILPLPLQFRL